MNCRWRQKLGLGRVDFMSENFLDASDAAIATFVAEHANKFGTSDVSAEKPLLAVAEKRMAIERRRYGFAILEVEGHGMHTHTAVNESLRSLVGCDLSST